MAQHRFTNEQLVSARLAREWSQEDFAEAYDLKAAAMAERGRISVRQVRRWENGECTWPNRDARRVLVALFEMTLDQLGFIRPPARTGGCVVPSVDMELEDDVRRRTFLGGVLVGSAPLFDLAALDHLTAAARNARRYSDGELVAHLAEALDEAARADGRIGPHQALPATLGILAAINSAAREAGDSIRQQLLQLGSRGAELAAWIHKDAGAPARETAYWHHQSKEWAILAGDGPMHAYVLLRQAQATDRDEAPRMLDLARAATQGPWTLPPRPRAEALQQEARALAMTGGRIDDVERTLDQAHRALDQAIPATEDPHCTGPLGDSYTRERLMVQSAICYREAGEPERAVAVFQLHLANAAFAPRDRAFFIAQLSSALALAGEADEAATAALQALDLAQPTHFGQALAELQRTARLLHLHAERPAVAELRTRLTLSPA
jgi:transcriptional regulator with XRE-family HTH domain